MICLIPLRFLVRKRNISHAHNRHAFDCSVGQFIDLLQLLVAILGADWYDQTTTDLELIHQLGKDYNYLSLLKQIGQNLQLEGVLEQLHPHGLHCRERVRDNQDVRRLP